MPPPNGRKCDTALALLILPLALLALARPESAVCGVEAPSSAVPPSPPPPTAPQVTLRKDDGRLIVRTPFYEAAVTPDNGGRITSLVFQGTEMTAVSSGGHGGIIEEVHTADFPFRVLQQETTDRQVTITLSADAGDLRVQKRYAFSADHPWLAVDLTFENRSPFHLRGTAAPAVRALALPVRRAADADRVPPGEPSGRALYCLDRGAGAETLSPDIFLASVREDPAPALRWIAAADPASRRALGFALVQDGAISGCGPLAPLRTDSGIVFGWSYPAIPPGQSLSTTVLAVPLDGFAAVAELNQSFAAESLPQPGAGPLAMRLAMTALRDELRDVSVVTRTYDGSGAELDPCDALLLDVLPPSAPRTGLITWPGKAGRPAWLVHEVYAAGRKLGRFAVPLGLAEGRSPIAPEPPVPPRFTSAQGAPSPGTPAVPQRSERAVLLRHFDGALADRPMERLDLTLTQNEARTVYVGLRALRAMEKLHFAVAGAETGPGGAAPLPPAAVYLWQVAEDDPGRAVLKPVADLSLAADETIWLAVTADSRQLKPGTYAARLVFGADSDLLQVPLSVEVLPLAPASRDGFALWHIHDAPAPTGSPSAADVLSEPALGRLMDYGVSALTVPVPVPPDATPASVRGFVQGTAPHGLSLLSFAGDGRGLPPATASPGALLLPFPDPVWLLNAGSASAGAARAAADAGYAPALFCEGLGTVPADILAQKTAFPFWLVQDGCEPGRIPQMLQSGIISDSASVWLYLDLSETDWQAAAIEVRSALWAAAWQGLAGAAVRCLPPSRDAERQPVIWHILRDARNEVALWRDAGRLLSASPAPGQPPDPQVARRLGTIESIVGPAEGRQLRLRKDRRPFRLLYRVAPAAGRPRLSLKELDDARAHVLAVLRETRRSASAAAPDLYWRRIPLEEDGRLRWAIAAADDEAAGKAAVDLQEALRQATGRAVPVWRTFPDLQPDPPRLIWALAGSSIPGDWPEPVRIAAARRPGDQLVAVDLPNGVTVGVLKNGFSLKVLLRAFQPVQDVYPTARSVR